MDLFMQEAIAEARLSLLQGGIPIGSVLVRDGQVIGKGHNRRVQDKNPIMHAEINCLQSAGRVGSYKDSVLYSTLMPCYLCAGAIVQFNIKKIVVGEDETFSGAKEFLESHGVEVINQNLNECKDLMRNFIINHPKLWNEDIGKL